MHCEMLLLVKCALRKGNCGIGSYNQKTTFVDSCLQCTLGRQQMDRIIAMDKLLFWLLLLVDAIRSLGQDCQSRLFATVQVYLIDITWQEPCTIIAHGCHCGTCLIDNFGRLQWQPSHGCLVADLGQFGTTIVIDCCCQSTNSMFHPGK